MLLVDVVVLGATVVVVVGCGCGAGSATTRTGAGGETAGGGAGGTNTGKTTVVVVVVELVDVVVDEDVVVVVLAAATSVVESPLGQSRPTVTTITTTARPRTYGPRRRRRTARFGSRTRGSTTGGFAAGPGGTYMRAWANTFRTSGSKCSSGSVS